jgi:hypothetical protein
MEKAREHLCFIDYSQAFDSAEHLNMWNSMRSMGMPGHLMVLIRDLYTEQEAKVQFEHGTRERFPLKVE